MPEESFRQMAHLKLATAVATQKYLTSNDTDYTFELHTANGLDGFTEYMKTYHHEEFLHYVKLLEKQSMVDRLKG